MLTPIKQEEKSSLNIIFQLYKKAIKNNSIAEMNDINFIAVHNQRYPVVLEWHKWIIKLTNNWKDQVNSESHKHCIKQLKFLLEKIAIYKKIMLNGVPENAVLSLEKEFEFRQIDWTKQEQEFMKSLKQWNTGKLNCDTDKKLNSSNLECKKCVSNFDKILLLRLQEVNREIDFLVVNQISQFNKETIIQQLLNSYNNLIDMRLVNKEIMTGD